MAKEIGLKLKITSEGQDKVITNLKDLETELAKLQNDLKSADFGSKRFKEISANIQTLKSRIEDVDKATEGIGVEKRLRAISDTANLLTGSFQVLTGVVGSLTTDEETLKEVQEAETRAMNALNIALGIRAINEGILESRIFRREAAEKAGTIASKAYIATAKGLSSALNLIGVNAGVASTGVRALTSAFAALGIPLIIFGLVELYDALTNVNEEAPKIKNATEAYEDFNKAIEDSNAQLGIYIERNRILGNEAAANEQELAKIQDEVNKRLEKQRDLRGDLLIQEQIRDVNKNVDKAIADRAREEIKLIQKVQRENDLALSKLENDRLRVEKSITEAAKAEEEKRRRDAEANAKAVEQARIKSIQAALEKQKQYLSTLKVIADAELEVSNEVLERIREVLGQQEDLIKQRTDFATSETEKLVQTINDLFFKIIPTEGDAKLLEDVYLKIFTRVEEAVRMGTIELNKFKNSAGKLDLSGLVRAANEIGASKGFEPITTSVEKLNELITPEAQNTLVDYFNTIERFATELASAQNKDLLKGITSVDKARVDDSRKQINLLIEDAKKLIEDPTLLAGELEQKLTKIIQDRLGLQEQVVKGTETQKATIEAYNERVRLLTETLVSLATKEAKVVVESAKVGEQLKELAIQAKANEGALGRFEVSIGKVDGKLAVFVANTKKALTETELQNFGKLLADTFSQSSQAFTDFVQQIIDNEGAVKRVVDETGKTIVEARKGIREKLLEIISPQDLVKLISQASTSVADGAFKSSEEISKVIEKVKELQVLFGDALKTGTDGVEDLGAGYAVFAELIALLNKKMGELNNTTKEVGKTFAQTFSESEFKKISDQVFQVFNDLSNRLQNVVSTQNSLLLEQLDYEQQLTLKTIGEANSENEEENKRILAERAKAEADYRKKRFELEKQAKIQELQFTLANAIASSAQAIIQQFATLNPVAAGISAGIIAGITAIQVKLINDQIQFAQNKVFIGRQGGLIQGASHDDMSGGVPAMLEGGEFVVNKEAVKRYGDLIGAINTSTGGRPLAIDDSRLVQAIASQNASKTPIKTYVLYNDIKDTNKLNNKIEQLSRL